MIQFITKASWAEYVAYSKCKAINAHSQVIKDLGYVFVSATQDRVFHQKMTQNTLTVLPEGSER